MQIQFFDNPLETPKSREDVRLNDLGLYVYPDGRRVAVGFNLTPFLEKPCIEVRVVNERGEPAGWLNVIETIETNFSLTMHLRDKEPTQRYEVTAVVYYATPETERMDVHKLVKTFDATQVGEQ
ncbi:MAG: hypothetical protein KA362_07180 [Chloroflexi bacterium]|nr:hypothetical protein [Chloroflexota bacterium]MBK7918523.1 hypothetical protein [Chloroflexota bacterium]MBK8932620.1 hypothetical protein [Chloroflexota bacterium]MBP6803875.1 hypothetical protein [Chloroflexota bacterium]MBP7592020.1 hypothetical protein [Chloroflexota bacterium]